MYLTQIIYIHKNIQSISNVTVVQRWNGAENVFKISRQFKEYSALPGGLRSTESGVEAEKNGKEAPI